MSLSESLKDGVDLKYDVLKEFHAEFQRKLPKHYLYTPFLPLKVFHSEQLAKIFFPSWLSYSQVAPPSILSHLHHVPILVLNLPPKTNS